MGVGRQYRQPLTKVQKIRLMRAINYTRKGLLDSAIEEGELDMARSADGQREFVAHHRRLQGELSGQFPFLEIRNDSYVSDIAAQLAQDITHYVLTGDTPGTIR